MPLLLIVSEIYGRKLSKWWKIRNFFELFGPPYWNALADLDGSTPECAQVCALHIGLHLASLRKIEMVAVLCTNETTPMSFSLFCPPSGGRRPPKGEKTRPDPGYARTQNMAWIGPRVAEKSLTEQTNKHTVKQIPRPLLYERMTGKKTVKLIPRPSL